MNSPYLITFTPAGSFFFGGSISYSDRYSIESDRFPQPATVTGAIRTAILIGHELLRQHRKGRFVPGNKRDEAIKLAGDSKLNDFEENPNLGMIKKISPVFLAKISEQGSIEDAFFIAPGDIAKEKECSKFRITGYKTVPGFSCNCGKSLRSYIPKSDFKSKNEERFKFLGGKAFWSEYINDKCSGNGILNLDDKESSPFTPHSQVGITLKNKKVEEGKFYVKREYSLKRGYCFAVILWQNEKTDLKFARNIVLGGDQSVFLLEKKAIGDELAAHPIISHLLNSETGCLKADNLKPQKLAALFPMVLNENSTLSDKAIHAVVGGISHVRMLVSVNVKPEDSEKYIKDGKKVLKSESYRIIPSGSVFYLNGSLLELPAFSTKMPETIGYNSIIIL